MTTLPSLDRAPRADVLFFSHLRWDFVFQRPQHIVSRWARDHRVWFWEEPVHDANAPFVEVKARGGVQVVVPHLPPGQKDEVAAQRKLLDRFVAQVGVRDPVGWYWTPLMRAFSDHLPLSAVVWDCMDELSAFAGASPGLLAAEAALLRDADVVFTGGHSLYRAKRGRHPNVHALPSSVDVAHFARARTAPPDPADQRHLRRPRIGWFGVIDERTDLALLDELARARPDWELVMVGPVVKIDPATLPHPPNLHWLGMKGYDDLPAYIAHWDVAMLPFARNAATRYISPTKTPEYLAAGKPVVSTPIADVVRPYGVEGLVRIAEGPAAFEAAVAAALEEDPAERRARADAFLGELSWDTTVARMQDLVDEAMAGPVRRPVLAVAR